MHWKCFTKHKILHIRFWLSCLVQDSSDSTHSLLQNVPLQQRMNDWGKGTQSIIKTAFIHAFLLLLEWWRWLRLQLRGRRREDQRRDLGPQAGQTWPTSRWWPWPGWAAPVSYWDTTILSKIWTWTVDVVMLWQNQENAAENIGGCIDDHHHADNDETHSK